MGASQTAPFNAAEIGRRCEEVLWTPSEKPDEQRAALQEMEDYVRLLAPLLARLLPRMQEGMQGTARIVLRDANELLDGEAPSADLATRLHDAGTNARSLLALLERPGALAPSL
ncbi:hypothetical protein ACFY78_36905 [Streptomyces olindensis]|uniref:hypothetical protein n=1 Tax=Streptomyces olindensis TaxID=358823 RepID=UPI0036A7AF1A